jgi:hypothetical protein
VYASIIIMSVSTLDIFFIIGGGLPVLASVLATLIGQARWRREHKQNPTHLVVGKCILTALCYWSLFFAFSHYLRAADSITVWWIRYATHIPVSMLAAWTMCAGLWMLPHDGWLVILMGQPIAATCQLLAELSSHPRNYYWWSMATALQALVFAFVLRRSRRADRVGWFMVIGTAAFLGGMLLIQLLGYSMTGALDSAPERRNTEIGYLVVNGVGAILGVLSVLSHTAPSSDALLRTSIGTSDADAQAPLLPSKMQDQPIRTTPVPYNRRVAEASTTTI